VKNDFLLRRSVKRRSNLPRELATTIQKAAVMPQKKGRGVNVPPQLMQIVKNVSAREGDVNVTDAVVVIQSKAVRELNSYIQCVCMRMNL
jgi:hypothetical protein